MLDGTELDRLADDGNPWCDGDCTGPDVDQQEVFDDFLGDDLDGVDFHRMTDDGCPHVWDDDE